MRHSYQQSPPAGKPCANHDSTANRQNLFVAESKSGFRGLGCEPAARWRRVQPAYGQLRAANELKQRGVFISPGAFVASGCVTTWRLSRNASKL
jgi:hypothetical protein